MANKNGYGDSKVYSAVHYTDFVGRSPWLVGRSKYIVGGNNPTGGVEDKPFAYSHSAYSWEVPKKYLQDESGHYIDVNGNRVNTPVKNPYLDDFEELWKNGLNHNQNTDNPSRPVWIPPSNQ